MYVFSNETEMGKQKKIIIIVPEKTADNLDRDERMERLAEDGQR